MSQASAEPNGSAARLGVASLLAQVGGHEAAVFGRRLKQLDLTAADAGLLRSVAARPGQSQQALAATLGVLPSRVVVLLDELEERGLVRRAPNPDDRRHNAVTLTGSGQALLGRLADVARQHDAELTACLSGQERDALCAMLRRVAEQEGLTPGAARASVA